MADAKAIEGVERLQWGNGRENTFMASLAAALHAMGDDVTYDYLMGVSGAAFRLHFHQPEWCRSSPDAGCGFDCTETAHKALGYAAHGISSSKDNPEEVKQVRAAVVESINQGRAVLAIDLCVVPDWGLIVGYEDGGKQFLCRTYYEKSDEYSPAEKWPWIVIIIGEKGKAPDRKQSLMRSLELAMKLANTEKFGKYASGFAAYEVWARDLLNDSRFAKLTEKQLRDDCHTNAWCYHSLVDARAAAVRYLHSIAGDFDEQATGHILQAADLYEQLLENLRDGSKYAPFPQQMKEGEKWTQEMRHAEAGVLKEALGVEKQAVDELKAAVESVNNAP